HSNLGEARLLDPVAGESVALARPAVRTTEGEEAGMLARAVVLERRRLGAALELVLGCSRGGEQAADGCELLRASEMRRAGDGELLVGQVGSGLYERECLERLGRGAEECHEAWVAGMHRQAACVDNRGVHAMPRLEDAAAPHLDLDRLHLGSIFRKQGHVPGTVPGPCLFVALACWLRRRS